MTVGERIQLSRKRMGMSQVDFAAKINVSKQTLYKYENNLITNNLVTKKIITTNTLLLLMALELFCNG